MSSILWRSILFSFILIVMHNKCIAIDYNTFNSIEEIIDLETSNISSADNNLDLANAYLSRAESYLISDNAQLALDDLNSGYNLGLSIESGNEKYPILFRSYFGMIIAYSNLGLEDSAKKASEDLNELIEFLQSQPCVENPKWNEIKFTGFCIPMVVIEDEIDSEDMSRWCEEAVTGTAEAMRLLASNAKSLSARLSLLGSISALEARCLKCCRTGEFWKTCVGPIYEKWKAWNEKYTLFRIPPDPAWD